MGRVVKDEKELAQAIKNNVDYIEVEGGIKDFFISKSVFKSVPSKSNNIAFFILILLFKHYIYFIKKR